MLEYNKQFIIYVIFIRAVILTALVFKSVMTVFIMTRNSA